MCGIVVKGVLPIFSIPWLKGSLIQTPLCDLNFNDVWSFGGFLVAMLFQGERTE